MNGTFYHPTVTEVSNNEIYILAHTNDEAKNSRIFVYNMELDKVCEINLPHTLHNENSLIQINNHLYYRYALNQNDYAYHKISDCNLLVSIPEVNQNKSVKVFPNPSKGVFSVHSDEGSLNGKYAILDISGKLIMKGEITQPIQEIDIRSLQSGIYLMDIENHGAIRLIKE